MKLCIHIHQILSFGSLVCWHSKLFKEKKNGQILVRNFSDFQKVVRNPIPILNQCPWLDLVFMTANNLKAAMQWPLESCKFYFNLLSHLIMQSIDFNSILFSVRGCQVHYALFTLNHCKRDQAASGSALIQNIHTWLQNSKMPPWSFQGINNKLYKCTQHCFRRMLTAVQQCNLRTITSPSTAAHCTSWYQVAFRYEGL